MRIDGGAKFSPFLLLILLVLMLWAVFPSAFETIDLINDVLAEHPVNIKKNGQTD